MNNDPLDSDADGNGLSDYQEVMYHGTNPLREDTDGDGMGDAFEVENDLDPLTSVVAGEGGGGGGDDAHPIWRFTPPAFPRGSPSAVR